MRPTQPDIIDGGGDAACLKSLHLEKHGDGASDPTEGAPTKASALRKLRVSGAGVEC